MKWAWKTFKKSSTTCEDALHKTDVESGLGALFSIFQHDLSFMWVGDVTALKVTSSWDGVESKCLLRHIHENREPQCNKILYEKYMHKHRTSELI